MPATAAAPSKPGASFKAPNHDLLSRVKSSDSKQLPQSVMPKSGTHAFLLELKVRPTGAAFSAAKPQGLRAAKSAAKDQLSTVRASQARVVSSLPSGTRVLYRTHAATNAVAVLADAKQVSKLQAIAGVTAVYPIAAKTPSNSYAVPLVGAPAAWTNGTGFLGEGVRIAIIDTGLDYTHANFGGPGTAEAYDDAHATEDQAADPALFPNNKIIGGFDFAGDAYDANADAGDPASVPHPDPNPLDCNGHGSHVGGTAAGFGENADGTTYDGDYDTNTPFDTMKIGPGMAPLASLYAYRVFGCEGSSSVVGQAMDRAADPNGDGDTSDHVDVINMSLGSDYGSALDGDAIQADNLAALGINVVVASGNGGDLYEVGGSPGNAPRTLTVANSVDAQSIIDSVHVTAPEAIAGDFGAERSVAYDWDNDPDLAGDVVALTQATNLDGCDPLNGTDAALVDGKVAFLEWTDDDSARRCGSVARSGNVAAAGAIGFIFADDEEAFAAGITGSAVIPGVMVTKSAGDAIRSHLADGVSVNGTEHNGFKLELPGDDDKLNSGSSRGIRAAGGVKPDVAAVGTSVFSTEVGTGDGGMSIGGTSMATPQVAGLAALVVNKHPNWTSEEVKADIMNTAGQDLFTGDNHTGDVYGPNRVGAGRIQAGAALANDVLAYVQDDAGAVSVSFGPLEVTGPVNLKKTVKVVNKGATTASYDVSYDGINEIPGVDYTVSPSSVTLAAGETKTVDVTLKITDPSALTKTIDPTMDAIQGGFPRDFLADASGRVLFLNQGDGPDLRVPVYSAPRPASQMTQAKKLGLGAPDGDGIRTGTLALKGQGVDQGDGTELVQSQVSAFELQAESGLAPSCAVEGDNLCIHHADERSADIKSVGVTSASTDLCGTCLFFAINTHGAMHTPASQQEFDIVIDADRDGEPDFVTFNTRLGETDVFVTETVELASGDFDVVDIELINDRFGDIDTAVFDSDTIVMPVWAGALGIDPSDARVNYSVESYTGYGSVDVVGETTYGAPNGSMSFDVLNPGIFVNDWNALLNNDQPGQSLTIGSVADAYATEGGDGLLVVHHHNKLGDKAQVVELLTKTQAHLTMPASAFSGAPVAATVTVDNTGEAVPTGNVTLVTSTGKTIGSGSLDGTGTAHITAKVSPAGSYSVHAEYAGDATYAPEASDAAAFTATKNGAMVVIKAPGKVAKGTKVAAVVKVMKMYGLTPTGKVVLKAGKKTLGSAKLKAGKARITFKAGTTGTWKLKAKYSGDANYKAGSVTKKLNVV